MAPSLRPSTRFGVALPQSYRPGGDWLAQFSEFLVAVDESCIESVWMQEQLIGRDPSFEPLVALAFAAGVTEAVTLGTSTIVAPLRSPVLLAKQVATLDQLSGGRVVLTFSIGGDDPRIFDAAGVAVPDRVPRMLDTIAASQALWGQVDPQYEGRFVRLHDAPMEPKPVQRPHPPIWFGGDVDVALERAVRLGSGWMGAGASSTEAFAARVNRIERALDQVGKDRAEFTIAKKVYLSVDPDPVKAHDSLLEWFVGHWPEQMRPNELCRVAGAWGTADDVGSQIEAVVDAGADVILLNPVSNEFGQLESLIEIAGSACVADHRNSNEGVR